MGFLHILCGDYTLKPVLLESGLFQCLIPLSYAIVISADRRVYREFFLDLLREFLIGRGGEIVETRGFSSVARIPEWVWQGFAGRPPK